MSGFQKMPEVSNTAVSCGDVATNSQTASAKAVDSSSMIPKLQTSGIVVTSSPVACTAFVASKAGPVSVTSSLICGVRLRGPLKLITPEIQSPSPGLPGSAVGQVRPPFPLTAPTGVTQVSTVQNSNNQLRVSVPEARPTVPGAGILGPGPAARALGFPVMSQANRVPMQPVTANQNVRPNTSSPLVGQSPRGVFQPRLPQGQFPQPTVFGSQPRGAIGPMSALPSQQNDQPRATGPVLGPRGIVHPGAPSGPPMNQSAPPRSALPSDNQPYGPITPVLSRAAGPVRGQSTVRPQMTGPAVPVQMSLASASPRGPTVRAESQLPVSPAQASTIRQPSHQLAPAAGTDIVKLERGPPVTANSRIYVLNSDSSPLCKDVEVSV